MPLTNNNITSTHREHKLKQFKEQKLSHFSTKNKKWILGFNTLGLELKGVRLQRMEMKGLCLSVEDGTENMEQ
jgi:hypothetical protein